MGKCWVRERKRWRGGKRDGKGEEGREGLGMGMVQIYLHLTTHQLTHTKHETLDPHS